jgi:hypothetical protein
MSPAPLCCLVMVQACSYLCICNQVKYFKGLETVHEKLIKKPIPGTYQHHCSPFPPLASCLSVMRVFAGHLSASDEKRPSKKLKVQTDEKGASAAAPSTVAAAAEEEEDSKEQKPATAAASKKQKNKKEKKADTSPVPPSPGAPVVAAATAKAAAGDNKRKRKA